MIRHVAVIALPCVGLDWLVLALHQRHEDHNTSFEPLHLFLSVAKFSNLDDIFRRPDTKNDDIRTNGNPLLFVGLQKIVGLERNLKKSIDSLGTARF